MPDGLLDQWEFIDVPKKAPQPKSTGGGLLDQWEIVGGDSRNSESQAVANRPSQTAPVPLPGVLGRPAMPGVATRYAGPQSVALTPAMRASREEALTQPARGLREIGQGNIKTGLSDVIEGGGKLMLPVAAITAPMAPLSTTLGSITGGTILSKGGELTGKLLNWSPESTRLASDLGGLGGSVLGGMATTPEALGNAKDFAGRTLREPTGKLKPMVRATARIGGGLAGSTLGTGGTIVGGLAGPTIADAIIPEHPNRLPVRMPRGLAPSLEPDSGVLRIPEPRAALPTDRPGAMYSVPREQLPALAQQRVPGAADALRNTGQPIIYVVPEGYPGPRAATAQAAPRRIVLIRRAAD